MRLPAMLSVFPPTFRVMLIWATGRPSPAMIRTWSSVPSVTCARSRTRTPFATTTFATSSGLRASWSVTSRYCL